MRPTRLIVAPEIGTMLRPDFYDLRARKPAPLAPRERVVEAAERLDAQSGVVVALTDEEIARIVLEIGRIWPAAVAISPLFSFVDELKEEDAPASRASDSVLPGAGETIGGGCDTAAPVCPGSAWSRALDAADRPQADTPNARWSRAFTVKSRSDRSSAEG